MLDRNIPFYNMILRCDHIINSEIRLPDGYTFRFYEPGDEKEWAKLEYEIGDFDTMELAEEYFVTNYCQDINEIKRRCVFVLNQEKQIVGSCIAWHDFRNHQNVASLHWLIVSPGQQGKHLGKALCQKTMKIFEKLGEFPVYIHTQPWSYVAVFLYVKMGFWIQKEDTFSHYENQYTQAMEVLKKILSKGQYEELVAHSL